MVKTRLKGNSKPPEEPLEPPPCSSSQIVASTPVPSEDDPQPIQIFQLPDTFDYDSLVERAESEAEGDVVDDLDTGVHQLTVTDNNDTNPLSSSRSNASSLSSLPYHSNPSSSSSSNTASSAAPSSYHHRKRAAQRRGKRKADEMDESEAIDYSPSARTVQEAIRKAKTCRLDLDAAAFDAAKGAHTAKPGRRDTPSTLEEKAREWTLQELIDLGYLHIPWDGINPLLVVDCKGRIVAFLAGRPNHQDFVNDMTSLFNEMMSASRQMGWEGVLETLHKRGRFAAFNHGVTMGMGSSTPVVLRNEPQVESVITWLLSLPALKRLNSYHNSVVRTWEPRLHHAYRQTVEAMYRKLPHLTRNFKNSIFTASAFNFGGRVRTIEHRDHMNWPFGLCIITALGRFDATRSGHLVLKEFKLVFNFPHASSAAIPSACCTHFNTSLAPGEERVSFTQYTAGAIFRWVENEFRTEGSIKREDKSAWQAIQDRKKAAVAERLKLYSTVSEILELVD